MSRALTTFVAVLCIAGMLSWALPLPPWVIWPAALVLGLCLAAAARATGAGSGFAGGRRGEFLCDSCKYDNDRDCSRPERPNAARCPDYKSRFS